MTQSPDLVPMLLDASIDPCDGTVAPSLQYVLIRGFTAMGWEQPKAASEDMAMEILKMIRPSQLAHDQCPKCGGDCSDANPPVYDCPKVGCNRDF
jgi:hypothetical protein